jgi:hypothetical protein
MGLVKHTKGPLSNANLQDSVPNRIAPRVGFSASVGSSTAANALLVSPECQ